MSLAESGDSLEVVSLEKLFNNELKPTQIEEPTLNKLIQLLVRGGWLSALGMSEDDSLEITKSYIDAVINHAPY